MAIEFDGNGFIRPAKWVLSGPGNWEMIFDIDFLPSVSEVTPLSSPDNDANRAVYVEDNGTSVVVRRRTDVGGTGLKTLSTGGVNLRDGNPHQVRIVALNDTNYTLELYIDEGATPASTSQMDSNSANWEAGDIGRYHRFVAQSLAGGIAQNGVIFSRVRFIDNADANNSSDYLFEETTGTTASDSGGRSADGTLTSFSDPNAAWVSGGSEPTETVGVVVENIKAPNEPDELVADATSVEVAVWYDSSKNSAPDYFTTTAAITGGKLVLDLSGADPAPNFLDDGILEAWWLEDVGGSVFEDRYFTRRGEIFSDISAELE